MSWLSSSGVAGITGSRWSAGAVWADAADPDPSDYVWEDAGDWPLTYDDGGLPLTLRAYVGGHDVTELARSASWGAGQSDPFAQLSVSSCTLRLSPLWDDPDAELDALELAAPAPAAGDRVLITTEHDVLWAGFADDVAIERTASDDAATDAVVTVTASDDLAAAAATEWSGSIGGQLAGVILTLAARAGISVPNISPSSLSPNPYLKVEPATREGAVLSLLGDMLGAFAIAAAWSPEGLHVTSLSFSGIAVTGSGASDVLERASSYSLSRSMMDVVNEWTFESMNELLASGTFDVVDLDSIRRYRRRSRDVDVMAWALSTIAQDVYANLWADVTTAWTEPPERLRSSQGVYDSSDVLHRARPFDDIGEGTLELRLLALRHNVSVDAWTVDAEAIRPLA